VSSKNFAELLKRREGAYKAQIALCDSSKLVTITGLEGCCSGISSSMSNEHVKAFHANKRGGGGVFLCLPLKLIMDALHWSKLDFWSLDVEGAELEVLKGAKGIQVDVLMVENLSDDHHKKHQQVRDLLKGEWGLTFWDLRKRKRGFNGGILNEVYYNASSIQPLHKDLLEIII